MEIDGRKKNHASFLLKLVRKLIKKDGLLCLSRGSMLLVGFLMIKSNLLVVMGAKVQKYSACFIYIYKRLGPWTAKLCLQSLLLQQGLSRTATSYSYLSRVLRSCFQNHPLRLPNNSWKVNNDIYLIGTSPSVLLRSPRPWYLIKLIHSFTNRKHNTIHHYRN